MPLFDCLKWPEMREVARELIERIQRGHAGRRPFSIPVVDFVRLFSPGASERELARVSARGEMSFTPEAARGGSFALAPGERALVELGREGLVMRLPARMSGRYELLSDAFHITFNEGEELEGCKRLLLLVCNRVTRVEVSTRRVDVHLSKRFLDLCVEFD